MKNLILTIAIAYGLSIAQSFGQEVVATYDWTDNNGTISSQHPGEGESLKNLFDNKTETIYVLNGTTQAWIQYESPASIAITSYTIVSGPGNSLNDPRNWEFQFSDDGTVWTTLRSETGQTFGNRLMQKNYLGYTSVITPHKYFRLKINGNNGGSGLQLAELQLFGYPQVLENDITNNGGVITAQHIGFSGETFINAINDKFSGGGSKYTITNQRSGWLQYESPEPFVIQQYAITTPCCNWDRNPRSWRLLGSNDGENWKVVDVRINKTFIANAAVASPFNMQVYKIPQTAEVADWTFYADTAHQALMKEYWNGTYFNQDNNTTPHKGFNYWWHAHALDVTIDAYNRTQDVKYKDRMDALINGVLSKNGGTLKNTFYDDMEWMGLACLRAYYSTNDEKWKNYAIQLWNWIKVGWTENPPAGGGIMWATGSPSSKNAISNSPAAILSARLYKLTQDQDYLDWSKKIYQWVRDSVVDASRGLVWDSYGRRGEEGWIFTYNQGVYIGAGLELYLITNNDYYLAEAKRTASYVVNDRVKFCPRGVLQGEGTGDGGLFKGIFMRYLSQLIIHGNLDENTQRSYVNFFRENGKSLWNAATLKPRIIFGPDWLNRPSTPVISCSSHLSGVMMFELADELERLSLLPARDEKMAINAQKPYRYFRLDIIGNTRKRDANGSESSGNNDLHLAEWQLFGKVPEPPAVAITSPSNGTAFPLGTPITVNAEVSSFPGVTEISFYEGTTLIGTDSISPYSITWSNPSTGFYTITARATDDDQVTITSSPVEIIVDYDPSLQSVRLLCPDKNGAEIINGSSISIEAEVTNFLGATEVSFYNDNTLIATDTDIPYKIDWTPSSGIYYITAKARNANNSSVSQLLKLIVTVLPSRIFKRIIVIAPKCFPFFQAPSPNTIVAAKSYTDEDSGDEVGEQKRAPYPNPFSSSVFIPLTLKTPGPVSIRIYNSSGEIVYNAYFSALEPGEHYIEWKDISERTPDGLYSYMTVSNGVMKTGKIMRIK